MRFAWTPVAVLALSLWSGSAAAQSEFVGGTCAPMPSCRTAGAMCPDSSHPVTLSVDGTARCVCASGSDASAGTPTFCCNFADPACPTVGGVTGVCMNVDGSAADICLTPDVELCLDPASMVVSLETVRDCFTVPGSTGVQSYWRRGDCDGDMVPNGEEVRLGTSPCCNESTDLACCLSTSPDALGCCTAVDAADPGACCLTSGGDPGICCASDPVGCCEGTPAAAACCHDAGGELTECCGLEADPLGCCLSGGGELDVCCSSLGDDDVRCDADGGVGSDGGNALIDASTGDAGPGEDAGPRPDGGLDGGAPEGDGGTLGFGGGGGCRCTAQGSSAPSPLALVLGVLAIAIPSFRRRR